MRTNKGISLIVLVITIIVIIILAGAILLTLSDNNPAVYAKKATFLSDRANIQNAVTLYLATKMAEAGGAGLTPQAAIDAYLTDAGDNLETYFTSLGVSDSRLGTFVLSSGVVKYTLGPNDTESFWSADADVSGFVQP